MADSETAVVVGVGPGLGWHLAQRFAEAGMQVAVAARDRGRLERLMDGSPHESIQVFACDATEAAQVERLFDRVEEALGTPHLVVNNAGTFEPGPVLETDPADFERKMKNAAE